MQNVELMFIIIYVKNIFFIIIQHIFVLFFLFIIIQIKRNVFLISFIKDKHYKTLINLVT